MCIMGHMERIYVGNSEPKGPYKPTLWIKNDTVEGMAIYIRVGGRYVKFNSGSGDDETLYINATWVPVEQQTENNRFTIDKTMAEIEDALSHNKSIIFVIDGDDGTKTQTANFFVMHNDNSKQYVFEYTHFPSLSSSSLVYFAFTFDNDGTNYSSSFIMEHIPEIFVQEVGTALNYERDGGGALSVMVDDSTIGINGENKLYIKSSINNQSK